jgi:hypothetical protein
MVVHDKVYDCTSFVDEHPYVSSYLIPLSVFFSISNKILELHSTRSTHSTLHPQEPHSCTGVVSQEKRTTPPSSHPTSAQSTPSFTHPSSKHTPANPILPNSGGEEVMLDVGGQDATEAFEDVGHSDEAREILEGLLVGTVKRQPGDPTPKSSAQPTSSKTSGPDAAGLGTGLYAILLVGGALAYFAYSYLQANGEVKN